MAFEHLEPYVSNVKGYEGPVDRLSPYHYYQFVYWQLRRRWRTLLYDWTRREPCDAAVEVSPRQVLAGEKVPVTLTLTIGARELGAGGRVAFFCQKGFGGGQQALALQLFQGPDGETGYGSRISASCTNKSAKLRMRVHSAGAIFTVAEVFVEAGMLRQGEQMEIVFGDKSSKPQVVSERAKELPFRVAIDYQGDDTFLPLPTTPSVRIVGSKAVYLRCFATPTPLPGEPVCVRVATADIQNHNPSYHYNGMLRLVSGAYKAKVEVAESAHGVIEVRDVPVTAEGISRIKVTDDENGLMGVANPVAPGVAPRRLRLYYGEIHSHTELSDGTGTADDNFYWARHVEGLDFSALADHFEDGQSYNYTLADKWGRTVEAVRRHHEPGRFVTLLGYEIGTLQRHRNVYFRDDTGRMIVEGRGGEVVTMDNVYKKLEGTDYILIPHAPKFHGINWQTPHRADRQRLVEIFSHWGNSEEGGSGGFQSARRALDMGYRFGFTGGTDNHVAEPGNHNEGGITGLYAPELTREAVFDAMMARHTFATTGPRMILLFGSGEAIMGDEIATAPATRTQLHGRAICGDSIQRLEVICNGEVVFQANGGGKSECAFEWKDPLAVKQRLLPRVIDNSATVYYYMRVTTVEGAIGWTSPIWIACDTKYL